MINRRSFKKHSSKSPPRRCHPVNDSVSVGPNDSSTATLDPSSSGFQGFFKPDDESISVLSPVPIHPSSSHSFQTLNDPSRNSSQIDYSSHHGRSLPDSNSIKRCANVAQPCFGKSHGGSRSHHDPSSFRIHPQRATVLKTSRTLEMSLREKNVIDDKLRFDRLAIYGRDQETQLLQQAYDRAASKPPPSSPSQPAERRPSNAKKRELVLVHGESGSGKTSWVVSTLKQKSSNTNGTGAFVIGKFDSNQNDQPYTAMADACRQMCGEIVSLKNQGSYKYKELTSLLMENIGSELYLLKGIVPELCEILDDSATADLPQRQDQLVTAEQTRTRLHYVFRVFFRVVSQALSPLVFVLDDLQWSDTGSLGLLENVLMDWRSYEPMVVLIYRSDEVNGDSSLPYSKLIQDLREGGKGIGLNITDIALGNLSVENVNEILMELFWCDAPKATFPLAELCHRRTLGNAFFVLTFLRKLKDEKLLTMNLGTCQWHWDVDRILEKTDATSNVTQLMREELLRSPRAVQHCLSIAAFLGKSFKPKILDMTLGVLADADKDGEDLSKKHGLEESGTAKSWLQAAADWGFIEQQKTGGETVAYQWIHDSVREAALSLVSLESRSRLKGTIGQVLLRDQPPADSDAMVFVIANLLNDGPVQEDPSKRIELAELNLKAATRAVSLSAFDSAAKYAGRGIDLLPENRWENHYSLTMNLFNIAADTELGTGMHDLVEERYHEVAGQTSMPFSDKLQVFTAKIRQLAGQIRLEEAVELIVSVLRELNIKYPRNLAGQTAVMVANLARVRRRCKTLTMEDLWKLPEMTDPTDLRIMVLLNQLGTYAYRVEKNRILMVLAILTSAMLTFEKGVSAYSPPVLGHCGLLFSGVLSDTKLGGQMGKLAMNLLEQRQYKSMKANTIMMSFAFSRCWTEPMGSALSQYIEGYEVGFRSGDVESSFLCMWSYIVLGFQIGRPLRQLENDCRIYAPQMKEYGRNATLVLTAAYWLAFQKLMKTESTVTPLEGYDATMCFEDFLTIEDNEPTITNCVQHLQTWLCAIFEEYEEGTKLAMKTGNTGYARLAPGHFTIMPETFARALNLYTMARHSKKRRHRAHARQAHNTIRRWKQSGNPNVIHYNSLLNAEAAFMNGKFGEAEGYFQSAKVIASRSGLVQDAALAVQRYGGMLLEMKRTEEAVYMFEEAINLYKEWGALAKVQQIRETYAALWPTPLEITIP